MVPQALEEDPALFSQVHRVVPGNQPVVGELVQQCVGGFRVKTRRAFEVPDECTTGDMWASLGNQLEGVPRFWLDVSLG